MNNYSPNMLKTFDECQMKFLFKYVQRISVPQSSSFFEKGKKIHALANYYLNKADIDRMERVLTADEKTAWELLKANKYFKLQMLNTEYNLSCKVGKYWFGGRLDALMADGENYYILDYKTGNLPNNPEQDFQTFVYLLCVDKFLKSKKRTCNSLQFVYIGLKNDAEKIVLLSAELKNQYEERVVSICDKVEFAIKSDVFSKNKDGCSRCEYNKICNVGEFI